jgi:hypothetical protein
MDFRTKLDDGKFAEMTNLQAVLRSGKTGEDDLGSFRTNKQVVDNTLTAQNIDTTPKQGTSDSEKVSLFRRQVDMRVASEQQQKGRKLTSIEVQAIADNLIVEARISKRPWFWPDKTKRVFELEPGESFDIEYDNIPSWEKVKIEQAMVRRNVPITPGAVVKIYQRKLEKDRE